MTKGSSALKFFLSFVLLAFVTSCGYQAGQGNTLDGYCTVSIPCIPGDLRGELAQALIHTISTSSSLTYKRCEGDLCLEISICDQNALPIGYRVDPYSEEPPPKNIIPSEERLTLVALVTLTDRCNNCVLLDREPVSAWVEFDHDYYTSEKSTNLFSLDQLVNLSDAEETARRSLYKELAKQIVNRLNNY